jgi:hypothetical protein
MFFSISPNDYSQALLDEIYGCFKYIGIPIDTVMNMPVQTRKYFISKHNHDCEELDKKHNKNKNVSITGEATSEYTKISMSDYRIMGK